MFRLSTIIFSKSFLHNVPASGNDNDKELERGVLVQNSRESQQKQQKQQAQNERTQKQMNNERSQKENCK